MFSLLRLIPRVDWQRWTQNCANCTKKLGFFNYDSKLAVVDVDVVVVVVVVVVGIVVVRAV